VFVVAAGWFGAFVEVLRVCLMCVCDCVAWHFVFVILDGIFAASLRIGFLVCSEI